MVLRFAHITDTHFGVSEQDYNGHNFHVQEGHPEQLVEIVSALEVVVQREGLDYIIHSGDMINEYSVKNIQDSYEIFSQLSVPVYLCLGNHDLWHVNGATSAKSDWLHCAPNFFKGDVNFSIAHKDCLLHIVPNQWGADHYEWTNTQTASLNESQQDFLERAVRAHSQIYRR